MRDSKKAINFLGVITRVWIISLLAACSIVPRESSLIEQVKRALNEKRPQDALVLAYQILRRDPENRLARSLIVDALDNLRKQKEATDKSGYKEHKVGVLTVISGVPRGKEIRTLSGHTNYVGELVYSLDGRYIASASEDKTIRIWDATTGRKIRTFPIDAECRTIAYSPDGRYIVGAFGGLLNYVIKIWDLTTGVEIRTLSGHTDDVNSVAWSPDGIYIASGSHDKTIKIWDPATGEEVRTLSGHTEVVWSVVYSPDGRYIASGSSDKTVKIWDATTGAEIRTLSGHTENVHSVAYSSDGRYIATAGGGTIKIWDMITEEQTTINAGDTYPMAYSPDGRYIVTGCDNTIKIWDATTGIEIKTLTGHTSGISSIAYSPDGRYIASGSYEKTIKIWYVEPGVEIITPSGHEEIVDAIWFVSPDVGSYIVSRSGEEIKIWNTITGNVTTTFQ